ncbi:uncharacterized protein LOC114530616 [Dendronephthya gigantea]|uniref:uncharacterized protein LOC114530616 n=1 Tax=Dendronephthya gigantea TaxID=151771 RepID=UPI001069072B|nr:uncharacterized protein LOC114530616 [Dendronephthya gigantea]
MAIEELDFPVFAGGGGGVHLYKKWHDHEPWNWTGWVPLQKQWLCQGRFFSNRYFLALRGNEIQNNLWDYDPYEDVQKEDEGVDEMVYSQVQPNDRYKGGYWFHGQPFGRYLHIIALKSHTEKVKRYNYIVHPLAYRASIHTIPDNSVDAMQWCIINMPEEEHFGKDQPWGEKCHGLEIFNDFTYAHSYKKIEEDGPNNGELSEDEKGNKYYYWFDTYPLEFAVFLLDSALARGVYFHTMAANDAFYERSPEENIIDEPDGRKTKLIRESDPKDNLHKHNMNCDSPSKDARRRGPKAISMEITKTDGKPPKHFEDTSKTDLLDFVSQLPYKDKFVFGFVTLFDPTEVIKNTVFKERNGAQRILDKGLDDAENVVLDYLNKGRYYATTGIWEKFEFKNINHPAVLPLKIRNQPDPNELCYDLTLDMELVFTFPPCREKNIDIVWRYTIMHEYVNEESVMKLKTDHGYFKLDEKNSTHVDLSCYDKPHVKWLYFSAITPKNPQRRAWMHAIKGPAFGDPHLYARICRMKHYIVPTKRDKNHTVTPEKCIKPTKVTVSSEGDLDFVLGKATNGNDIYAYFMQVCPLQQDLTTMPVSVNIDKSSDHIPPRISQSVHGFFQLRNDYPTRLNMTASWDKETLKGDVNFYIIDGETGQPKPMDEKPKILVKKKSQLSIKQIKKKTVGLYHKLQPKS